MIDPDFLNIRPIPPIIAHLKNAPTKTPDALSAGKIVDISTDLLQAFATQNLGSFLTEVHGDPGAKSIAMFSAGVPSGGAPGVTPSGQYNQVLPGNTKDGKLNSARDLQEGFHTLAGMLHKSAQDMQEKATQFQYDLKNCAAVIAKADDDAKLTADQMTADLANLSPSTGTGTNSSSTQTDTNSSSTETGTNSPSTETTTNSQTQS